jgi:hypothetical protein
MTSQRTKPEIEQFIFDEFRRVCPLSFTERESRPEPEPDILCKIIGGKNIAYELTRIDDPGVIHKDQMVSRLTKDLRDARANLENGTLLHGYGVHVRFFKETYKDCRSIVPLVIQTLNEKGPVATMAIRVNGELLASIRCTDDSLDLPVQMSVFNATNVGDYTLETISKKFGKTYHTPYPIHLLAWATSNWLPDVWRDNLTTAFREQSIFERIWVYDRIENSILYDSDAIER